MQIQDYIKYAQLAQSRLKQHGKTAEHIYLARTGAKTALVFIAEEYDQLDLYHRAKLASMIRNGPLTLDFYIYSPAQLLESNAFVTRELIYHSDKIYGSKPLIFGDTEYASPKDLEYKFMASRR
ncbi:MAG: hypothetical protein JXA66_03480 [Oligoflexia bacterium]|nr:hypothetical protein [Oligoflexia bacterium]